MIFEVLWRNLRSWSLMRRPVELEVQLFKIGSCLRSSCFFFFGGGGGRGRDLKIWVGQLWVWVPNPNEMNLTILDLKYSLKCHIVDGTHPIHQLIVSLSHYLSILSGFIHPGWCRISSINSMMPWHIIGAYVLYNSLEPKSDCYFKHIKASWIVSNRGQTAQTTCNLLPRYPCNCNQNKKISVVLLIRSKTHENLNIQKMPLWKGLLLRGTPRIPTNNPNQQLAICWLFLTVELCFGCSLLPFLFPVIPPSVPRPWRFDGRSWEKKCKSHNLMEENPNERHRTRGIEFRGCCICFWEGNFGGENWTKQIDVYYYT